MKRRIIQLENDGLVQNRGFLGKESLVLLFRRTMPPEINPSLNLLLELQKITQLKALPLYSRHENSFCKIYPAQYFLIFRNIIRKRLE